MENKIIELLSRYKNVENFNRNTPFSEMGLTSVEAVGLIGELEEIVDKELPISFLYDNPTISLLCKALAKEMDCMADANLVDSEINDKTNSIAIVGISCRLPGINGVNEFWEFLNKNETLISELNLDRAQSLGYRKDEELPKGSFFDNVNGFDNNFFSISPKEARSLDPQQKQLLEVSWEALEDSGYVHDPLEGKDIGVYVAISSNEYASQLLYTGVEPDIYFITGNSNAMASNRISYYYNFIGPSLTIDTACSSSLVAVHLAKQALLNDECEMAMVGSSNIIYSRFITDTFQSAGMLSQDGAIRTFDDEASGYLRGEGTCFVILKKLNNAKRDNDRIYATIEGTCVSGGGKRNGVLAPSTITQSKVIFKACTEAQINPEDYAYIELHGTGTKIGDPIEAESIHKVIRNNSKNCYVGSVKPNIGHLESAAGLAGLIKTSLFIYNQTMLPNHSFNKINTLIDLEKIKVTMLTSKININIGDIYMGINSFGFGGTNAHAVLKSCLNETHLSKINQLEFIPFILSSNSLSSLHRYQLKFIKFLQSSRDCLENISYSLNSRRKFFNFKILYLVRSREELVNCIEQSIKSEYIPKTVYLENSVIRYFEEIEAMKVDLSENNKKIIQSYLNDTKVKYNYEKCSLISLPTYSWDWEYFFIPINSGVEKKIKGKISQFEQNELELKFSDFVKSRIANLLEIKFDLVDLNVPLLAIGMDSIQALDLKSDIEEKYNIKILISDILEDITLSELINVIIKSNPHIDH